MIKQPKNRPKGTPRLEHPIESERHRKLFQAMHETLGEQWYSAAQILKISAASPALRLALDGVLGTRPRNTLRVASYISRLAGARYGNLELTKETHFVGPRKTQRCAKYIVRKIQSDAEQSAELAGLLEGTRADAQAKARGIERKIDTAPTLEKKVAVIEQVARTIERDERREAIERDHEKAREVRRELKSEEQAKRDAWNAANPIRYIYATERLPKDQAERIARKLVHATVFDTDGSSRSFGVRISLGRGRDEQLLKYRQVEGMATYHGIRIDAMPKELMPLDQQRLGYDPALKYMRAADAGSSLTTAEIQAGNRRGSHRRWDPYNF